MRIEVSTLDVVTNGLRAHTDVRGRFRDRQVIRFQGVVPATGEIQNCMTQLVATTDARNEHLH